MIEFNKHTQMWDVTCDRCSTGQIEVEADDFRAAVRKVRWANWSVYKDPNEGWMHVCDDCE